MGIGRPVKPLILSGEDKEKLQVIARRPKTSQQQALRARIILYCARSLSNAEVAQKLEVSRVTVGKWRERFRVLGMQGLTDEPRPGAPRKITDAHVEDVVTRTLETLPDQGTHWSTRLMAKQTGLSQRAIVRIWHSFGLQPHRVESFKLSKDPFFVEKVRNIVGLYMDPPDRAMVLCVDEKSQVQALNRTQPILPLRPGVPARQTHDYERNGVTSLFAALDVATGKVTGACYRRHRHQEFLKFLDRVARDIPAGQEVHLIMDNYGTHKVDKVRRWFLRHPNFFAHFTPTGGSWLNLVERLFAELTERCVRRGSFNNTADLETAMLRYLEKRNVQPKPFVWHADADLILGKVQRLCQRISDSGH